MSIYGYIEKQKKDLYRAIDKDGSLRSFKISNLYL